MVTVVASVTSVCSKEIVFPALSYRVVAKVIAPSVVLPSTTVTLKSKSVPGVFVVSEGTSLFTVAPKLTLSTAVVAPSLTDL